MRKRRIATPTALSDKLPANRHAARHWAARSQGETARQGRRREMNTATISKRKLSLYCEKEPSLYRE